jgi:hypothetical protein
MAQRRLIDKKPAFLKAFIATGSLTEAAKAVKIDRGAHYDWLRDDPAYAEAFERARIEAGQTLEDIALEWATKGIWEPLVYQGQFCYAMRNRVLCLLPDGREVYEDELTGGDPKFDLTRFEIQSRRTITEPHGPPLGIHRRSEGLMGRLLKAFMPARYAERGAVEVTGKDGGPVESTLKIEFVRPKPKDPPKGPDDKDPKDE